MASWRVVPACLRPVLIVLTAACRGVQKGAHGRDRPGITRKALETAFIKKFALVRVLPRESKEDNAAARAVTVRAVQ